VADEGRGTRVGSGVLGVTCLSTLVVNANTSAVSILLPAISEDVGMSTDTLQWAVTGYSLVGAAVIVTAGALGDVFGRRRVFIGGLLLFVASCVLIALSDTGGGVIAGRMIQGAAGSTILACGLSLLSVAATGREQMRAVSLWGASAAIGAAAGPLVGGALVDLTGWQGLFWIDAAIALACVPLTLRAVGESRDPLRPRSIDWLGTVLVALVLAPVILALSQGPAWGWLSAATLGCFAVAVAAAFGFVAVERRVTAPLVDLRLLRNGLLVGATLAILISSGAVNALMYVLSLYLQNPATLAMSPLQAGLATLPAVAGMVVVAPLTSRICARFGTGPVIATGFALTAVSFGALAFVDPSWRYRAFVLPLVGMAIGMGLSNNPASSVATTAVPTEQVGAASGISNMARYVGAAVVTAAVASVYASAGTGSAEELATGLSRSSLLLALLSAAAVGLAFLARRHRARHPRVVDHAAAAAAPVHTLPV